MASLLRYICIKERLLMFHVLKAGYGTPSGPGGYQGWGAPPGPQGQQMPPPQWGSNYGGPPQQQGYGSYGKTQYSLH